MVKWLLLLTLFFAPMAQAKQRDFHALLGFSTNFTFPGTARLGWGEWELGKLTFSSYGVDKIFDLSEHTYATFGFVVATNLGFYGAVGFSYSWYKIGVRGELTTIFDFYGFSQGVGVLGVSYAF